MALLVPSDMAQKTWVISVDNEGEINLPEDLIECMKWKEDTVLQWNVNENGEITLTSAFPNQ